MRRRKARRRDISRALFLIAVMLFGYSVTHMSPSLLIQSSTDILATAVVSMTVGVGDNPDNVLARQLAQKEAELAAREERLSDPIVRKNSDEPFTDRYALYSFGMSIILFVLLIINYVMDWRRSRKLVVNTSRIVVS